MAKLRIIDGPLAGAEFPLEGAEIRIGRHPGCQIAVDDPKASRFHAGIAADPGGRPLLTDLGSSNGTFLNGERLKSGTPVSLSGGDELRIGRNLFRVFLSGGIPPELEIPGYALEDILVEGGMGSIFRAVERETGRVVAVKVLQPSFAGDAEFVARFIQEARAAARLSHPNIVKVYQAGKTANGRYYYIMELIRGSALSQRIGDLAVPEAARMFLEIAAALEYAHAHGVIHRDIKPDNILVDGDGEPKLTDLGIAVLAQPEPVRPERRVLGTPHYMSPEQAAGRIVTAATDIYSLGAAFYHVFAGRPPFDAGTAEEIMIKHVREKPRPLAEAAPGLPPALARVVDRALEKSLADRYPDAGTLRDALAAAVREAYGGAPAPWRRSAAWLTALLAGLLLAFLAAYAMFA